MRLPFTIACAILSLGPLADAGLINSQNAAFELCGIRILRIDQQLRKLPRDDQRIAIVFDEMPTESVISLVIRDSDHEKIGIISLRITKFSDEAEVDEDAYGTAFQLRHDVLAYSYFSFADYVIPFRLFFSENGEVAPSQVVSEPVSDFLVRSWNVLPDYTSEGHPSPGKAQTEPFASNRSKMTPAQVLRSWGVQLAEGTIFYYGLPTSELVISSTRACLEQIDQELRNRELLEEPHSDEQ